MHSLMAFGGIAALAAGSAMLLADGGAVFAPVTGMVGGIAAMALANHERLKLRIEVLEKRLAQAEWRGQPRRLNSGSGNDFFKGVQKKLRESAAASRTRRNSLTPTGSTSSTLRSASAYLAACAIARTAAAGLFRRSNTRLHPIR
jgi:hypothetical protein